MPTKLTSTLAAIAAVGIAPTAAMAAAPSSVPQPGSGASGIIAVLIGQVKAQPFTPPIGTEHGSFAARP